MQNNKEIKCRICGKTDSLDRWNKCNETKIMEKENVCFHCAFWIDKIATTNENTITNSQFKRGTMNNVLKGYKKNNNIKGHGACFPVELVKDLVNAFSKEGDIILDPFMGSGTTAVAALECNRKYIGFEIIPEYVDFANDRIQKLGIQDVDGLW